MTTCNINEQKLINRKIIFINRFCKLIKMKFIQENDGKCRIFNIWGGFFPICISSSEIIPKKVNEYLIVQSEKFHTFQILQSRMNQVSHCPHQIKKLCASRLEPLNEHENHHIMSTLLISNNAIKIFSKIK